MSRWRMWPWWARRMNSTASWYMPSSAQRKARWLQKEGLRNWCRGKIATIKIPQEIELTDHFPISATGKISKGQLRSLARSIWKEGDAADGAGNGERRTAADGNGKNCGRRKQEQENCGRRKRNQEDCGGQIGRQLSLVRGPERQERTVGIHGKNHNSEKRRQNWCRTERSSVRQSRE